MTGVLYNPQPTLRNKGILSLIWVALWLICVSPASARLSQLAKAPDWNQLAPYQGTITRNEFVRLLHSYAPNGAAANYILIDGDHALIRKKIGEPGFYVLKFARDTASARKPPAWWHPLPAGNILGAKIALDPGHLGGQWARMEERWYQIGNSIPVMEGELTLLVAQKIAARLEDLGAEVTFVRDKTEPLTPLRPEGLRKIAEASLRDKAPPSPAPFAPDDAAIRHEAELLFYRVGEIRARAERNNRILQPDLTLCLHFNAEPWGDATHPTLVPKNHFHMIVNGNYEATEIAQDDVRFDLVHKILGRTLDTELTLSDKISRKMGTLTGLPPYHYITPNALQTGTSGYVWLRNLLANRLYQNPVLYFEPYVMNNQEVFDRIQMGDYDGTKPVHGVDRPSIFNEYADAVVQGLLSAVSE